MKKAICIPVVLFVASFFICSIVCAQPERAEKIKSQIMMHKQAIERLRAELMSMGVPPPEGSAPAATAVVPPPPSAVRGNPPGPKGGRGTDWANPPGPKGGPGTSPGRKRGIDKDNNPPGPKGGRGTNWENPPGPKGGRGASPNKRGGKR